MHTNAPSKYPPRKYSMGKPTLGYAKTFGRWGSFARHMVKLLMAGLMMFGLAAQAAVEFVPPVPGTEIAYYYIPTSATTTLNGSDISTPQGVCRSYARYMDAYSRWVAQSGYGHPLYTFTVDRVEDAGPYGENRRYACWIRNDQTGEFMANGVLIYPNTASAPICPTATPSYTYNPTTSMCEREQPVLYTIALHDLNVGGELAPSASRSAYAQVMEGATAKGGIAVTLTSTAPAEAGTAILSPASGSTGGDGKLNFTFTAPPVDGTHTVTATCDGGKCSAPATGTVVVTACPEKDDLSEISALSKKFAETPEQVVLTNELESGVDGYSLLSKETRAAEQCLRGRITPLLSSTKVYTVGSTVRTYAYQAHLREVWDKYVALKGAVSKDKANKQRCAALITKVEGKMGFLLTQNPSPEAVPKITCNTALGNSGNRSHCIRFQPAKDDPKHVATTAFDIASNAVDGAKTLLALRNAFEGTSNTVQTVANACDLNWGGKFGDSVHFSLQ